MAIKRQTRNSKQSQCCWWTYEEGKLVARELKELTQNSKQSQCCRCTYLITEKKKYGRDRGTIITWGGGSEAAKTALGPVGFRNELEELQKLWDAFSRAPRREHIVCKMEFIIFPPVVLPEENRYATCIQWFWCGPRCGSTKWMLWLTVRCL